MLFRPAAEVVAGAAVTAAAGAVTFGCTALTAGGSPNGSDLRMTGVGAGGTNGLETASAIAPINGLCGEYMRGWASGTSVIVVAAGAPVTISETCASCASRPDGAEK